MIVLMIDCLVLSLKNFKNMKRVNLNIFSKNVYIVYALSFNPLDTTWSHLQKLETFQRLGELQDLFTHWPGQWSRALPFSEDPGPMLMHFSCLSLTQCIVSWTRLPINSLPVWFVWIWQCDQLIENSLSPHCILPSFVGRSQHLFPQYKTSSLFSSYLPPAPKLSA